MAPTMKVYCLECDFEKRLHPREPRPDGWDVTDVSAVLARQHWWLHGHTARATMNVEAAPTDDFTHLEGHPAVSG